MIKNQDCPEPDTDLSVRHIYTSTEMLSTCVRHSLYVMLFVSIMPCHKLS